MGWQENRVEHCTIDAQILPGSSTRLTSFCPQLTQYLPFLIYAFRSIPILRIGIRVVIVACTRKSQETPELRCRIDRAIHSQSCRSSACFSPHILVTEAGYFVTVFTSDRPQSTGVSTQALGEYLTALPLRREMLRTSFRKTVSFLINWKASNENVPV
jgi:hypothetical protein